MVDPDGLARAFHAQYRRWPRLYRAPGRVNLIGEHTDYNDGFVMPIAIDRSTWVAAAPRTDRRVAARSLAYDDMVTIDLDSGDRRRAAEACPSDGVGGAGLQPWPRHWSDYVRGVAMVLSEQARLGGADLLIASDVPIGAGLSSSAALEAACGYALLDLAGRDIELAALAFACQRAEHEYAGMRCGVMDQMIACLGRTGQVLQLDTRTLDARWVPLPDTLRVVVCNTMVAHAHASGQYNARRADCEAGVRVLSGMFPHIAALRDATLAELDAASSGMTPQVYRRCRHVITENARVEAAAAALIARDFQEVGRLMAASHASLRDDYEVSCPELDTMVDCAAGLAGAFGARMTGGGFGGCVVALVEGGAVAPVTDGEVALVRQIQQRYQAATGIRADVWICAAGPGVGTVEAMVRG